MCVLGEFKKFIKVPKNRPIIAQPSEWPIPPPVYMRRVGKKSAGRLLDGKEWTQYPEVARG